MTVVINWLKNITGKDCLQDNLTFVSLYIAIYEHMVDYVVSNLKYFLCDWQIQDGKEVWILTEAYKNEIKNRIVDDFGNKDVTKASFLWLVDNDAIDDADYQCFLNAKALRNRFAHELTTVIYQGVQESEIKLFFDMFAVYKKISTWYFLNIEAAILGEELPTEADLTSVKTTAEVMFGSVLNVLYNGKSKEYQTILASVECDAHTDTQI